MDVSPGGLGESSSGREDPTVPPTSDESGSQFTTVREGPSVDDSHPEEDRRENVRIEEHHSGAEVCPVVISNNEEVHLTALCQGRVTQGVGDPASSQPTVGRENGRSPSGLSGSEGRGGVEREREKSKPRGHRPCVIVCLAECA